MSFENDSVAAFSPRTFAVAFTRRLRKHKGTSHRPSLRTSISIPRFLSARYFRTHSLTPNDYLQAAILNTVPEDQALAELIARDLLFPKVEEEKKVAAQKAKAESAEAAGIVAPAGADDDDPMAAIMADLATLDIDLDQIDDLGEVTEDAADLSAGAFELFEKLYSSADKQERALAELVVTFGGAAELEAYGADTLEKVEVYAREMVLGTAGTLSAAQVQWACAATFGNELAHAASVPWELAGVFAGTKESGELSAHLNDLEANATMRERGRTLLYLKEAVVHDVLDKSVTEELTKSIREKVRHVVDHSEFLFGLESYEAPSESVLKASLGDNIHRSLDAARWIQKRFGEDLSPALYELWSDEQGTKYLPILTTVFVDCPRWKSDIDKAFAQHLTTMEPSDLDDNVSLSEALQKTGIKHGGLLAAKVATEALCIVDVNEEFLPLLDAFLEREIIPHDIERVIAAGQALGIDPNHIYDRIGDAVKQLYAMVMGDSHDTERYKRLCQKAMHIPEEMMQEMVANSVSCDNLEAMAALLAANMGEASKHAPDDFVTGALGYKGIGGGSNLLKQWFDHREGLRASLKDQVKLQAKEALLDLAFDWINKGEGSSEQGLIPQSRVKPFSAGDDLDALDLESTLDSIIGSGISLEQVREENLFVSDSAKGRAALAVLIDISGSMSGRELAMCAIAVVMLLGKVRSEEVALAVFESDTHVMKTFSDGASLEEVADKVLDLAATGGTRVDAAMTWVRDQFESVVEAEFRLLFLLSDFYFFEEKKDLDRLCQNVSDQGAILLGASHGGYDKNVATRMVDIIGGRNIELKNAESLPSILLETLKQIGDDAFR